MHAPGYLHDKENFLLPSWMQVKWPEFQLSSISLEIVHCKKLNVGNVGMQEACILGMQIVPTGTTFFWVSQCLLMRNFWPSPLQKLLRAKLSQNQTTKDHHAFLALYGLFPDMIKLFRNKDAKRIVGFLGFSFGTL